jgi:ring-1,2-phenylacetyl-CoA epoxidase subunit PaaC
VIRLGDGTEESHRRIADAANFLWDYTGELFIPAEFEKEGAEGVVVDPTVFRSMWEDKVKDIFNQANLEIPTEKKTFTGGKQGQDHPYLESILGELQYMQRTYPGCEW